jgi:hypothetical protein
LAIDKPEAKVMDLAVGSGTLLVAAYRRKRELLQKVKGTIELEDHKRFLEQDLTGIDIMPFAAHLAVVHLSLQALLYETERVRVAVWDSTELKPGQTIPAIWSELKAAYRRPTLDMFAKGELSEEAYVTKGALTLEGVGGERIPLEHADLIIMNPPFTRYQRLPADYKFVLAKRLSEYQELLHGQMGYYGYFITLADRFLKVDGKLALVLPATVLRVKSTLGMRKLLVRNYHLQHILTTWGRSAFSEGVRFREILLVAKKLQIAGQKDASYDALQSTITVIKRLPQTLEQAKEIAQQIGDFSSKSNIGDIKETDKFVSRIFSQKKLLENVDNLFPFIAFQDFKLLDLWDEIVEKGTR